MIRRDIERLAIMVFAVKMIVLGIKLWMALGQPLNLARHTHQPGLASQDMPGDQSRNYAASSFI